MVKTLWPFKWLRTDIVLHRLNVRRSPLLLASLQKLKMLWSTRAANWNEKNLDMICIMTFLSKAKASTMNCTFIGKAAINLYTLVSKDTLGFRSLIEINNLCIKTNATMPLWPCADTSRFCWPRSYKTRNKLNGVYNPTSLNLIFRKEVNRWLVLENQTVVKKSCKRWHKCWNLPRGASHITTVKLAKQIGVSEAALYHHFPSKARMFEGLIEFIEEALMSQRINRILDEEEKARRRIHVHCSLSWSFLKA